MALPNIDSVAQAIRSAPVWVKHKAYYNPEPEGYERDPAPYKAVDLLELQQRQLKEHFLLLQDIKTIVSMKRIWSKKDAEGSTVWSDNEVRAWREEYEALLTSVNGRLEKLTGLKYDIKELG